MPFACDVGRIATCLAQGFANVGIPRLCPERFRSPRLRFRETLRPLGIPGEAGQRITNGGAMRQRVEHLAVTFPLCRRMCSPAGHALDIRRAGCFAGRSRCGADASQARPRRSLHADSNRPPADGSVAGSRYRLVHHLVAPATGRDTAASTIVRAAAPLAAHHPAVAEHELMVGRGCTASRHCRAPPRATRRARYSAAHRAAIR